MPSGFGSYLTVTDRAGQVSTCGSTSRHFGRQTAQGFDVIVNMQPQIAVIRLKNTWGCKGLEALLGEEG